ncbi:MAG: hypothetical protein IJO36_07890 [Clostridia bacterium]|nr:hypothetical protein [Clostridia bacterium]
MSASFAGHEIRKFDQGNRIAVPTMFRKDLGESFIVLKSIQDEPCLVLFSEEEWINFCDGVTEMFEGRQQAAVQRKLASMSDKVSLDKQGRITLKEDFKAHAMLENEVLAVGTVNRVELWAPDVWDEWNDKQDVSLAGISYTAKGGRR